MALKLFLGVDVYVHGMGKGPRDTPLATRDGDAQTRNGVVAVYYVAGKTPVATIQLAPHPARLFAASRILQSSSSVKLSPVVPTHAEATHVVQEICFSRQGLHRSTVPQFHTVRPYYLYST